MHRLFRRLFCTWWEFAILLLVIQAYIMTHSLVVLYSALVLFALSIAAIETLYFKWPPKVILTIRILHFIPLALGILGIIQQDIGFIFAALVGLGLK